MAGIKGRPNRGKYSTPYDNPPAYTGPHWIGKPLTPPPSGVGPEWIGKRMVSRSIPRRWGDGLPPSDTIGA